MKYIYFCLVIVLSSLTIFAQNAKKIEFSIEPSFEKIGPDVTVAKLIFKVSDELKSKPLKVELWSPKGDPIISTDFPIVESTKLIESEVMIQDGKFEMDYLFPIRGEYRMRLSSGDYSQEQFFTLKENPSEVANFAFLAGILIVFGLISGLVLGRGAYLKAMAKAEEA